MTSRKDPFSGFKSVRKQRLSRRQQEMRKQRVALVFITAFVLLILGVVSYGYVSTFVLPPRKLVVRVDKTKYTMGDMIKILRMMQRGSEFFGQRMDLSTIPFQVPLTLAQNEIIAKNAPRYNIQVTDEEIMTEIRSRLLPTPDPSQQIPQEQLDSEFKERYRQYLNAIQLSEKEYKTVVKADLMRDKMREVVGQDIPRIAPQVHLYAISLAQAGDYNILKSKYKDGTPWEQLVKEFNQDATIAGEKGDLGWFPKGIEGSLDQLLFDTLQVGELSEPLTSSDASSGSTTMVFMVKEKADARPVDDKNMEILKNNALQAWLDEQWNKFDIETHFTSDDYAWITKQLGISTILPTPQSNTSPIR